MDNTCTPTYHRMWNRDFTLLIIAELLLCVACYMTIPFLPCRLYWNNYVDAEWACLTMGAFVAGIGISGFSAAGSYNATAATRYFDIHILPKRYNPRHDNIRRIGQQTHRHHSENVANGGVHMGRICVWSCQARSLMYITY